jgi:pimeloyl-ACP methyl ester carboxylesterase
VLGAFVFVLRYIIKTPQPLKSVLPGEDRLYKWTQGHIFYKVFGAEDAPPLVLFHSPEIGASAYEMRHIVDGLAKNYRVYAPDLLGFGLSDHPKITYSAQTYIALLEDFLRNVVQQPAVVLASGLSCNYGVVVAHRHPELCLRLVLLSPSPLYNRQQYSALRRYTIGYTSLGFLCYAIMTERWLLRSVLARQHGIARQQVTDGELAHAFAVAHQRGAHYAACAYLAGELDLDVEALLDTLRQPTLIIWGEQAVQPLVPEGQRVTTTAQDSVVQVTTLPATGVRLQEERPTKVVDRVLSWRAPEETVSTRPATEEVEPEIVAKETETESEAVKIAEPEKTEEEAEAVKIVKTEKTEKEAEDVKIAKPEEIEKEAEDVKIAKPEETEKEVVATPGAEVAVEAAIVPEEPIPTVEETVPVKTTEAYCVKCRLKRPMQDAKQIVTKSGRNAMEGLCPVCGTRLFRFIAR